MNEPFTISIMTENNIGLLARITNQFTKRHINIESLNVSESEIEGVSRFTIVVNSTEARIALIVKQIEKQIEVFRAFYHRAEEVVYQEIALYKLPLQALQMGIELEKIVRAENARILSVEENFIVIEKTGHSHETQLLLQKLRPFGVKEFVRSGRVSITKPMDSYHEFIDDVKSKAAIAI